MFLVKYICDYIKKSRKSKLLPIVVFIFFIPNQMIYGASIDDYNITYCDGFVDDTYFDFDYTDVVNSLYNTTINEESILKNLTNILFEEINKLSKTIFVCIGIIICGAFFKNVTDIFKNTAISNCANIVIYSAVMILIINCFESGYLICKGVTGTILDFLYVLFPTFFCTVAFANGSISAGLLYQLTIGILCLINVVVVNFLLPMTHYYMVLSVINNASDGKKFKYLCKTIKKLIIYANRILIGIILGLTTIKSMTIPLTDNIRNTFIKKSFAFIPGIGSGASALCDTVISCGNVVKKTFGIAGIIIVFIIMIVPFIKLFAMNLLMNFLCAVTEPIAHEKITNGINAISDSVGILIYIICTSSVTLMSLLGILCIATGG